MCCMPNDGADIHYMFTKILSLKSLRILQVQVGPPPSAAKVKNSFLNYEDLKIRNLNLNSIQERKGS